MKFLLLIIATAVLLSSCKKEGCIDENANNYNSEAEKDDASCTYDGSAIFWINASTSTSFQNSNINELKVYVDDQFIGILSTNSSLLVAPTCETGGGINHYEDLASSSDKIIKYKVTYVPFVPPGVPQPDEVIEAEGSVKLVGGKCISFLIQ